MTATILDGRSALATIKDELRARVKALAERGVVPGLGTVLVGDDPASHAYVAGKHRDCADAGISSIRRDLPARATQRQVEAAVAELNADPGCHGYLVQLPLPAHLDTQRVLEKVDPAKDADGLHPVSLGRLVLGFDTPLPCTPRGVIDLLRRYGIPLAGANVTVVGRGTTVGRPLGLLLTRRDVNATVTLCHTGTRDLAAHTRDADIVVVAAGMPGLLRADMIRPGAVVVDVGITRVVGPDGKGRYTGDAAPEIAEVAGYLAPVPGGIGPMTRGMLLTNVVELAERAAAGAAERHGTDGPDGYGHTL